MECSPHCAYQILNTRNVTVASCCSSKVCDFKIRSTDSVDGSYFLVSYYVLCGFYLILWLCLWVFLPPPFSSCECPRCRFMALSVEERKACWRGDWRFTSLTLPPMSQLRSLPQGLPRNLLSSVLIQLCFQPLVSASGAEWRKAPV